MTILAYDAKAVQTAYAFYERSETMYKDYSADREKEVPLS